MGSQRVGHDWATSLSLFTFMHWRRKWQPTPLFLPGESQGRGSLVGCRLWGHTESDMTKVTQQLHILEACAHFLFYFYQERWLVQKIWKSLFLTRKSQLLVVNFFLLNEWLKKLFYWRIIALQNFVVFCQTSTWISHRYTYIPSLLNLPPHLTPLDWLGDF